MFGRGGPVKVFVATRPVDFGKGIDGPALAAREKAEAALRGVTAEASRKPKRNRDIRRPS